MKIKRIARKKINEMVYCLKVDNELGIVVAKFPKSKIPVIIGQCNFGYAYGAWWSSYQKIQLVKNKIKISDKEAKEARATFMSLYKTLAQHIEQIKYEFEHGKPRTIQQKDSMGNTYTQTVPYAKEINTLFGRRLAADTYNKALNYAVQGSGGDCSKLAMIIFEDTVKEQNIDAFLANMVHDDIVCQASLEDKERGIKALCDSMNFAANFLMGHLFETEVDPEVFCEIPAVKAP